MTQKNGQTLDEAKYCAPVDFGDWHITVDGETTLCGDHSVKGHHMSGTVGDTYKPRKDCEECAREYGLIDDSGG